MNVGDIVRYKRLDGLFPDDEIYDKREKYPYGVLLEESEEGNCLVMWCGTFFDETGQEIKGPEQLWATKKMLEPAPRFKYI